MLLSQGCELHMVLATGMGLKWHRGPNQLPPGPKQAKEGERRGFGVRSSRGGGGVLPVALPAAVQQHIEDGNQRHYGQAPKDDTQEHRVAPSWQRREW